MNRKQRESNKQNARALQPSTPCPNCGKPGPHFAPPAFGGAGFVI
jgi:hypothetical protein